MSTIKVSPADLRKLGAKCKTEAQAITSVRTTVNSAILGTDWDSPAAKKFQGDWNTTYVKNLKALEVALEKLGQAANTMAANYDATEAAYKAG